MTAMKEFGTWMISRRKSLGIRYRKDFARRATVAETLVWELETGAGLPFHDRTGSTRKSIAELLKVEVEALESFSRGESGAPEVKNRYRFQRDDPPEMVRVDLFESMPATRRDLREPSHVGSIMVPESMGASFAVVVDGPCMSPEYPHGSIAFFRNAAGNGLISGKDYLITFDDGECTFKQLILLPDDITVVILRARNPDKSQFPDRRVERKTVEAAAVVVWRQLGPPA